MERRGGASQGLPRLARPRDGLVVVSVSEVGGLLEEHERMSPSLTSGPDGPARRAWFSPLVLGLVAVAWVGLWLVVVSRGSPVALVPLLAGIGLLIWVGDAMLDRGADVDAEATSLPGRAAGRPTTVRADVTAWSGRKTRVDRPRKTAPRVRRPHSRRR